MSSIPALLLGTVLMITNMLIKLYVHNAVTRGALVRRRIICSHHSA